MEPGTLFDKVVRITYTYLGPAAERFVSRQIINHLDKKPQDLINRDMSGLIDWLRVAMGFLTEDQGMVRDYISQLEALQPQAPAQSKKRKHKERLATHADVA